MSFTGTSWYCFSACTALLQGLHHELSGLQVLACAHPMGQQLSPILGVFSTCLLLRATFFCFQLRHLQGSTGQRVHVGEVGELASVAHAHLSAHSTRVHAHI